VQGVHAESGSTSRREVALAAAAALIYLAVAAAVLHSALGGGLVLSAAAGVVRDGPFPDSMRERAVDGVRCLSDSAQCFVPWLRYAADALEQDGHLPLWKDTAGTGAPLLGNGQSAMFFPTNLLAIALGAPAAIVGWQAVLELAAGAFCAWSLARHLGLSFLASLLCGLVFGFGGFQVVWYLHPQTNVSLLLPLLVLAADRLVLAPSAARVAAVGLVAGLQHLGGHPETAFHCQVAVLALGAVRAVSLRASGGPGVGRRLLALLAGLVLGALVGAVQTLPLLEYLAQSASLAGRTATAPQGESFDELAAVGFAVALGVALVALQRLARDRRIVPWAALLFVATALGLVVGLAAGLRPTFVMPLSCDWLGTPRSFLGTSLYHEENGAFAGAALPLAALGMLAGRPRGLARVAGWTLGLGLLAGYHAPILSQALEAFPVFRVAMNSRLQLVALLATAVLAACGLDALGRAARGARDRARLALLVLVPALAAVVALAVGVRLDLVEGGDLPGWPEGATIVEAGWLSAAQVDPLLADALAGSPAADVESAGPCRVFRGWVRLDRPPSDIRVLYGSAGGSASAVWRAAPVERVPPAAAPDDAPGDQLYALHAAVPERELLPGGWGLRVWAALSDGRSVVSGLIAGPETPGTWLPFPSQPAPGGGTARILLLSALVLALLVLMPARPRTRGLLRAALPLLVAASLLPMLAGLIPLLPPELRYPPSPVFDTLRAARPEGRVLSMNTWELMPEVATHYGVADLRSYDGLDPVRVERLVGAAVGRRVDSGVARREAVADFPLLGLMSVRFLANLDTPPAGFAPVPTPPGAESFAIVENPWFLPRARLVSGAVVEPDDERALALLRAPDFARERTVVLATGPSPPAAPGAAGDARIVESRPDRVRVDIAPTVPGFLILSDTFFPGWTVTVDGQPRDILRANVAFRAVPVSPGEHAVEFRYAPLSFRIGGVVSILAVLVAVVGVTRRATSRRAAA
jgi:hypothetical protein